MKLTDQPETAAATDGDAAYVRIDLTERHRPGALLEVTIRSGSALAGGETSLVIKSVGEVSEYILGPAKDGWLHALIDPGAEPVASAYLRGPHGAPIASEEVHWRTVTAPALFWRALWRQPAEALSAIYWRCLGKRVRARNRLKRILAPIAGNKAGGWPARHGDEWRNELAAISARFAVQRPPSISVLALGPSMGRVLHDDHSVDGVAPYSAYDLVAAAGRVSQAIDRAKGELLFLLRAGDRLFPGALWRLAAAITASPDAHAIYGDYLIDEPSIGFRRPCLTPGWNLPYYLAEDYIGAVAVRRSSLETASARVEWNDTEPGLLIDRVLVSIAASVGAGAIHRIPRLLTIQDGAAARARSSPGHIAARCGALSACLPDGGPSVAIDPSGGARVVYPLPPDDKLPLVSFIVATRDRVDLLRACIEGLRFRTDYPRLEIIIADNASVEASTLAYFEALRSDPRVRICRVAGPFNFSAINNAAAAEARGDVLLFLNNDTEVMDAGWLREMVAPVLRPEIGAVGAKLLYPSGLVQHAGVIVGLGGLAGHAHRFFAPDHPGYMHRLQVGHYVSAVTAACLAIERKKFELIGGLDAAAYPIALNDVDLCLRLKERGFESYWTPHAVLLHKESASRARDVSAARRAGYERECENFRLRWRRYIDDDPYYHPALTRTKEDFAFIEFD